MISKEEYNILLRCKKPREQEEEMRNLYSSLTFDQMLFRKECGNVTLYKTTYKGIKAIKEYEDARRNKIIALVTLMLSAASVITAIIGFFV